MGAKIEVVKRLLKEIHRGTSAEELKKNYAPVLSAISPVEIALIEQQLVKEGVAVDEILKLCDLHVALFRDFLVGRELRDVPKGHPLDLLIKENEEILKAAESLSMRITAILNRSGGDIKDLGQKALESADKLYRASRLHYQKIQMTLFPYLERLGIYAIPRVLWGREHEAIAKVRRLRELLRRGGINEAAELGRSVASEASELIFRENKILFPTLWALLKEGMWAAVHEDAKEIGWAVDAAEQWIPKAEPVYPWQLESIAIDEETLSKLPAEARMVVMNTQGGLRPDEYKLVGEGDIDVGTGLLKINELKGVLSSIPIELTFADKEGRVRLFTKSRFLRGFPRVNALLARRLEFCHPPKLEPTVKKIFEDLKAGAEDYREFYTEVGGRIMRVLAVAVKGDEGEFLGALEIVEDVTDYVEKPDEVKRKIVIL